MPLEFESLSHGKIVFGFFNIETDMILLNQYFFFAEDFCFSISRAAEKIDGAFETAWQAYRIEPENIGNLMGAIHGWDHRGFIGEVYRLFPFPRHKEDFKQKPEGNQTRTTIQTLIQKYGLNTLLTLRIGPKGDQNAIGEYIFNGPSFRQLIEYIWLGGLPRWKNSIRPGYVKTMKEAIERSCHPLFKNLFRIEKS